MKKSKYLPAFQKLAKEAPELFELIGDCLLIEVIPDDEFKTKGGLILASGNDRQVNGLQADKPTFVRVLLVGAGYYDDDTLEPVALDSSPGDIVLVGTTSIKKFSVFGKLMTYGEATLGLIRESDIQLRFKGEEGFDRTFELLNSSAEEEMARGQK